MSKVEELAIAKIGKAPTCYSAKLRCDFVLRRLPKLV